MRLKVIGYAVEAGWALALGAGVVFVNDRRWAEAALSLSMFLVGRSVDLLVGRLEKKEEEAARTAVATGVIRSTR